MNNFDAKKVKEELMFQVMPIHKEHQLLLPMCALSDLQNHL